MQFYLVGGFVRSLFTGEHTKDIDICVVGTTYEALLEFLLDNGAQIILPAPEYHHLFFCGSAYQMPDDSNTTSWNMGVIKAKIAGQVIDFCLARRELDVDYTQDNVVPVSVVNTPDVTLLEDLERRDFTMNAMAIPVEFYHIDWWASFSNPKRIKSEWLEHHFTNVLDHIIDPYNGRKHIEEKWIHIVGSAFDRFSADPTRILRALKFALRLDFQLSAEIQDTLWQRQEELCALYEQKVNPDRSCNELVQVFKQAPSWRVMQAFDRYIPPSLLRSLFCGDKINLYPSLKL
jgi:tRNA nucleotidyltransferase/poly(A) polymerase